MEPLTVVPCTAAVTVVATAPLTHRCPFVDETDYGTVTIAWTVTDKTPELHDLAEYLAYYSSQEVSHEDITHQITQHLIQSGIDAQVTTTWQTAGISITVQGVSDGTVLREPDQQPEGA